MAKITAVTNGMTGALATAQLNEAMKTVEVDGVTITGNGEAGAELVAEPQAVIPDGVTITGTGLTGDPLVAIAQSVSIDANQVAHGYTLGQPVYFNGATYELARANSEATLGTYIVSEVVDADNFVITNSGVLEGLTALTAGQYYYVSDITAGGIVSVEPSAGSFSNPVLLALSATTAQILQVRPLYLNPDVAELQSNKDATGGYVGLTGFKHNFTNALGTIVSLFSNANTAIREYVFPDASGTVALNSTLFSSGGASESGWNDLTMPFNIKNSALTEPSYQAVGNGLYSLEWTVNEALATIYHTPHDYKLGTNGYPHVHWMPQTALTVGQVTTWEFQYTIARGHHQGESLAGVTTTIQFTHVADGTEIAGEHMITECSDVQAFDLIEPDTIVCAVIKLAQSDSGAIHADLCDLHYQVDKAATLNKTPNFYV